MTKYFTRRISALLFIFCVCAWNVFAQTENGLKTDGEERSPILLTISTLEDITLSINDLKSEIREKERESENKRDSDEIQRLYERLGDLENNFERVAIGLDIEDPDAEPKKDFNWKDEIQDLLGPVLHELKIMTEKPRKVEKLRSELEFYKNRMPSVKKAVENIGMLLAETRNRELKRRFSDLLKAWENREQRVANRIKVITYQLDEIERQKTSILESTQSILKVFFKSRGKNFLFSLLVFIIVFIVFRLLHKLIYKISPIHKTDDRPFYIRLFDVIYYLLTVAGATCALLVTLYVSGDWVLLSLVIIFLLGVIWTAKQGLPRFWEQINLLLNLGSVREHERVLYQGIPWKVVSLNIYTYLENPELKSGRIRLPLRNLVELTSRPFHPNEPWFPCRLNDWVLLSDDTFGKIVAQTPDLVQVVLRGGARKTYLTETFLGLNPVNLSGNFRLRVTFGVDYGHQAISTDEIPGKLGELIREKLDQDGYGGNLIALRAEFKEAGASSLDLEILADFKGKAAEYYQRLGRAMQRYSVDACNKYGWVIPFTQVTLHTGDTEQESPPAAE